MADICISSPLHVYRSILAWCLTLNTAYLQGEGRRLLEAQGQPCSTWLGWGACILSDWPWQLVGVDSLLQHLHRADWRGEIRVSPPGAAKAVICSGWCHSDSPIQWRYLRESWAWDIHNCGTVECGRQPQAALAKARFCTIARMCRLPKKSRSTMMVLVLTPIFTHWRGAPTARVATPFVR